MGSERTGRPYDAGADSEYRNRYADSEERSHRLRFDSLDTFDLENQSIVESFLGELGPRVRCELLHRALVDLRTDDIVRSEQGEERSE